MRGPTCIFWANLTPFLLEGALPTPDGHLTIDRGAVLHDAAEQIELMAAAPGGLANLRKHIKVNYRHEAGDDAGGVSRDFFTNFSLAMANGRAVARCDFRLHFRAARGEPVPYRVHADCALAPAGWDAALERFSVPAAAGGGGQLRAGATVLVYERRDRPGNSGAVALRVLLGGGGGKQAAEAPGNAPYNAWLVGIATPYNGVQVGVRAPDGGPALATPDLTVRKGDVLILTHGSRPRETPPQRAAAVAAAVEETVRAAELDAELAVTDAELARLGGAAPRRAEAGPAAVEALQGPLQAVYAESEAVDFALLSKAEVKAMAVCSGYVEPGGRGGGGTARRGDFHRAFVDVYPGLFGRTKEGSVTPTPAEVWRFASKAHVVVGGERFDGTAATFGARDADLAGLRAVGFEGAGAACAGQLAVFRRTYDPEAFEFDSTGFVAKARAAQAAGARGVLFVNARDSLGHADPHRGLAADSARDDGADVAIPVVCLPAAAADALPAGPDGVAAALHLSSAVPGRGHAALGTHAGPLYGMYKDCGRVCGMALYHGHLLGLPLARPFIRLLQEDEPRSLPDLMRELLAEDAEDPLAKSYFAAIDRDRAMYEYIGSDMDEYSRLTRTLSAMPSFGPVPLQPGGLATPVRGAAERDAYLSLKLRRQLVDAVRWQVRRALGCL